MKNVVYLCREKKKNMARQIAPTPPLTGQAAVDFITEYEKHDKASEEEKIKTIEGYERIKSMLTFDF